MNTVTIGVSQLDDTKGRMRRAFRGEKQGAFIGFASLELLWRVLTPKRGGRSLAMGAQRARAFNFAFELFVLDLFDSACHPERAILSDADKPICRGGFVL
jgi:predicted transcriptional regulator